MKSLKVLITMQASKVKKILKNPKLLKWAKAPKAPKVLIIIFAITLYVNVKEDFTISLQSNPTTGYSWQIANLSKLKNLELVKTEFINDKSNDNNRVGQGGVQNFIFKARKTGKEKIIFKYTRPWQKEENEKPADEKTYIIVIQ
jgi:predicted secreted protein